MLSDNSAPGCVPRKHIIKHQAAAAPSCWGAPADRGVGMMYAAAHLRHVGLVAKQLQHISSADLLITFRVWAVDGELAVLQQRSREPQELGPAYQGTWAPGVLSSET